MTKKILAISIFIITAGVIMLYPISQKDANANTASPAHNPIEQVMPSQAAKIDVVFVLDTTGSMGGLIQAAKEKIWSIATTLSSAQTAPEIRIGLVAYRDRGDAYVTQVIDLTDDLDSMYAKLMEFQANGGGDGPESVNQALYDAVNKISWSRNDNTYKVVFLVGDAPPHTDYQNDVQYPVTIAQAKQQGIVINTIQCGGQADTQQTWRHIAVLGTGDYFQVGQSGNAVAITSPYDEEIAVLSRELDKTKLYYGDKKVKARQKRKQAATTKLHESLSIASQARRAEFNASKSGKKNFLGEGELANDVSSGRVDLDSIKKDDLPATMQTMPIDEQRKLIGEIVEERKSLKQKLQGLAAKRSRYIGKEVAEKGGLKDSLDIQIYEAVKKQADKKGIKYKAEAPVY